MRKLDRAKFKSTFAFTDLLFNLLVGFVFLFIIAFILINPPTKKSDAPKKAEFLIIIEWDDKLNDDVDLWVMDPNGDTVSFRQKEIGLMHLEKDDLGHSNDTYMDSDGNSQVIPIQREVVTFRGIEQGRYQAAVHIYSRKINFKKDVDADGKVRSGYDTRQGWVRATLVRLNPTYQEVYVTEKYYNRRGQEVTLFNFTLDKDGIVTEINEDANNIILRGSLGASGPNPSTGANTPPPQPPLRIDLDDGGNTRL
jgi:hypothetical protein